MMGQWRSSLQIMGLLPRFATPPAVDAPQPGATADAATERRRERYDQAIDVIAATLTDVTSLEELMRRYWDGYWYGPAASARSSARSSRSKKDAQGRDSFRTLLKDTCQRFAPAGQPLAEQVVVAGAYYRRAIQLLSGWWTAGTPLPPAPHLEGQQDSAPSAVTSEATSEPPVKARRRASSARVERTEIKKTPAKPSRRRSKTSGRSVTARPERSAQSQERPKPQRTTKAPRRNREAER